MTQLDNTTIRYKYWEVVSPPSEYFNMEFPCASVFFLLYLSCATATIGSASSQFSRMAKNAKNRQKVSKIIFNTLFDNFRAAPIFRPFWGVLFRGGREIISFVQWNEPSPNHVQCRFGLICWEWRGPIANECFRGLHREYFIFAVLRTLYSCSEMSFFYLKTCTPPEGNPLKHRHWFLLQTMGSREGFQGDAAGPAPRGIFELPEGELEQVVGATTLKTLTSLNKEVRPFFLSDNSIWSHPSVSSLGDYSIWRS